MSTVTYYAKSDGRVTNGFSEKGFGQTTAVALEQLTADPKNSRMRLVAEQLEC